MFKKRILTLFVLLMMLTTIQTNVLAELPPLVVGEQKDDIITYFKQYDWDVSNLDFYIGSTNDCIATKRVAVDGFVDRYFIEFTIQYDNNHKMADSLIRCYPLMYNSFNQGYPVYNMFYHPHYNTSIFDFDINTKVKTVDKIMKQFYTENMMKPYDNQVKKLSFGGILLDETTQKELSSLFKSYWNKKNFKFYAIPEWKSNNNIDITEKQQKEIIEKSKAVSDGKVIQNTICSFELSHIAYSEHIYQIKNSNNRFVLDFCIYKTNIDNNINNPIVYHCFIIAKTYTQKNNLQPDIFIYAPDTTFEFIQKDMVNHYKQTSLK